MNRLTKILFCLFCLSIASGCAHKKDILIITGYGNPPVDAQESEKRLLAYQEALEDAWEKIFNRVREIQAGPNEQIGDRLVVDLRGRARVINAIWSAPVQRQTYDPDTEVAEVVIRCDLNKILRAYAQ